MAMIVGDYVIIGADFFLSLQYKAIKGTIDDITFCILTVLSVGIT